MNPEEFVKIQTDLPDHPKVLEAGPIAGWLYIKALCWSRHYLTDGFIPDHVVEEFRLRLDRYCDSVNDQSEALASRLQRAGLFEAKEGGYLIHDYDKHQQTKQVVQERREELSRIRSQAGRKGGQASAEARRSKTNLEVRSKKLDKNPPTPLTGENPNGRNRKPAPEEIPSMVDAVTACQHFIAGRAWDDSYDEPAMREEFGRIERGRRTFGTIDPAELAGLLEQWQATRQDRYGIKTDL